MARRRGGCGRFIGVAMKPAFAAPRSLRAGTASFESSPICRSSSIHKAVIRERGKLLRGQCDHKAFDALESSREIFFIDAMHLVDARAGKLDWPAHAKIVFQNPAEFNVSNQTRFTAPPHFLDESQNDRAAGGRAVQGPADAKKREAPGRKGVLPDPRDDAGQA